MEIVYTQQSSQENIQVTTKICPNCNKEKLLQNFAIRKDKKISGLCISCYEQYYASNTHKYLLPLKGIMKICSFCKKTKLLDEFYVNDQGITGSCKLCYSKYCKKQLKPKIIIEKPKNISNIEFVVQLPSDYHICRICKTSKHVDEFKKSTKRTCAVCYNIKFLHMKKITNPCVKKNNYSIEQKKKNSDAINKRRDERRKFIYELLSKNGCAKCPCKDWRLLEFDHIDPKLKTGDVGRMIYKSSMRMLKLELTKCQILCPNCHRLTTMEMFGSWRWTYEKENGIEPKEEFDIDEILSRWRV